MDTGSVTKVVEDVIGLVGEYYVDPAAAPRISEVVAAALAAGRYGADERSLAAAVTVDLQSVNGDKHLRLLYHADPLAGQGHGDEAADWAVLARWAGQTCGGVASLERLPGNVGYLDIQPVLFPAANSRPWLHFCAATCTTTSPSNSPACTSARPAASGSSGRCRSCPAAGSAPPSLCTCSPAPPRFPAASRSATDSKSG